MADLLHWRTLTTAINEIPAVGSFLLDHVFKTKVQALAEEIDVDLLVGGKKLAPFVSPVEGGIVVDKLARKMQTVKAPRLRPKKVMAANDLLSVRAPGSALYLGPGGADVYLEQRVATELADLKNMIVRTTEWMAAQSLLGKLTVNQENIAFEIDYLLPSEHKPVLTGTDLWSDTANSDPVADILTWKRLISQATGYSPDVAIAGKDAVDALLAHTKVREMLNYRNFQIGEIAVGRSNYIGRLAGVDIYEYDGIYIDTSGTSQNFIPDTAFVMIASEGPFRLHYALAYDLDNQVAVAQPFFAKSWTEADPSLLWLLAESRPLPVPHWPECVVYATVTA
ncbi:major capsid protein [candidate division WOR-3 bacterium]|nr:major capsid protein [candidate division WOR-3 bacterium]